jgi:hypothetical protein
VTLHVNGAFLVTHDHSLGAFGGAIVEGPFKWPVRPVAELMVEEDSGRTIAGLVGGIWQVRDNLSLDLGWRVGESRVLPCGSSAPASRGPFHSGHAVGRAPRDRSACRHDEGHVHSRRPTGSPRAGMGWLAAIAIAGAQIGKPTRTNESVLEMLT